MIQEYKNYTVEHQWVWQQLFSRQNENLLKKGTALHVDSVMNLKEIFNQESIPHLAELSNALLEKTGWQIHIVKGFIPAIEFLELLANKKFAASTWLRKPEELDYLEEPDMFHDVYGHLPILSDKDYANFVHKVGLLGKKHHNNNECIDLLERFYWYSIEFGLIKENEETKILGAGIISSFGETNRIFDNKEVIIKAFNLSEILYLPFDKSALQPVYYVADSYNQLYESVNELETILEETAYNITV
jgi:phenylalanine-4-hydroxylase